MKKILMLMFLSFLLAATNVMAAGSSVNATFSKINTPYTGTHGLVKVVIDWLADDANASVPDTAFDSDDMVGILGRYCVIGITDPGSPAPTTDYDIVINDEYGCDIFGGEINNLSATVTEQAFPKAGNGYGNRPCAGTLTFSLSGNSVNATTGKCILYFGIKE